MVGRSFSIKEKDFDKELLFFHFLLSVNPSCISGIKSTDKEKNNVGSLRPPYKLIIISHRIFCSFIITSEINQKIDIEIYEIFVNTFVY